MSDLSDIRTQIKSVIESVITSGKVYEYERLADTWEKTISLYKTTGGKYHGWTISRQQTATQAERYRIKHRAHIFRIQAFYSLNDVDASELTFQDLLESVEAAFDVDKTLSGTCETTWPTWWPMAGIPGFSIDNVSNRMVAGVLCNYAECRICAVELTS